MPSTFPRGRFVWNELLTTDPDAAAGFYAKVVGWKVQPYEHDRAYRLWTMGRSPMGGLMRLPEEARRMGEPPRWMPHVAVSDVDQTVQRARGMGARVHAPPRDIAPGRFAVLGDPQGAAFSVFTPAPSESEGTDEPGIGGFSWHELAAADWKTAWEFYRTLFGWEHTSSFDMGPGDTYWMFRRAGGERPIGGMYNRPAGMSAPPHWLCYARVASADAAALAVTRSGGKVVNGPMDVPGGDRVAMCVDPQGAAFAVHAVAVRTAGAAAPRKRTVAKKRRKPAARARSKRQAKPKRTKRPRARRRQTR